MLVILGMGGLSIYYQRTFKNVNDQYDQAANTLKVCQQELSQTAATLQSTVTNLNSTETDIRKYDSLYEQKNAELSETQKALEDTKANLQKETLFKQQFQKQSEAYYAQMQTLQLNVSKLVNRVADLNAEVNDYEDYSDCLLDKTDSQETLQCSLD
jgi:chromosome segregation ATPase